MLRNFFQYLGGVSPEDGIVGVLVFAVAMVALCDGVKRIFCSRKPQRIPKMDDG